MHSQGSSKYQGPLPADFSRSVFDGRDIRLGDAGQARQLILAEALQLAYGPQHFAGGNRAVYLGLHEILSIDLHGRPPEISIHGA